MAKAADPLTLHRISEPIVLDGWSDEAAWDNIPSLPFVMHKPVFGSPPTERTEVRIAYDDDYLYVAGRLYDREPDKIQATSYKRDSDKANSEWFGIALDTYNDKENAVAFFTTPTGLRWDGSIIEGTGGITVNSNWNSYWEVATQRSKEGWFAEFRIPFSSLRFQENNGQVTMGLISWRLIARKNEWVIFPAISDQWGNASFYKISQAQEVSLEPIPSKRPVYVSPYAVLGKSLSHTLNSEHTQYHKEQNFKLESGLDIKYGVTNNLTLDVTLNTDFSQVEVDDRVVNLDRYSIFLPEKRQFFLERNRSFDFSFTESNQVFYSRRIGLYEGNPVRIWGGLRLVGRIGKWDTGVLNMQTGTYNSLASRNLGVYRLRRQVLNSYSYVGGILTTSLGLDGRYNSVYGLDGLFRLAGNDYLKIAVAQSQETGNHTNVWSTWALRYHANWERRSTQGLSYQLGTSWVGRDYHPDLGFESRENYHSLNLLLQYNWFAAEKSSVYRHAIHTRSYLLMSNEDGRVESSDLNLAWKTETKSGYALSIQPYRRYERTQDTIRWLNQVEVLPGKYIFHELEVNANTPTTNNFMLSTQLKAGTFYDGDRVSFTVQPIWNLSAHIELEGYYQMDRIRFSGRDQEVLNHLGRLKTLFLLNTKLSVALFLQYSNNEELGISNVRLRYNPREGNDLYIVYNHSANTDRWESYPVPPFTNQWDLSIKYVYTFVKS